MDKRRYIANELRRVFAEHTEIATLNAEVADKMAQAAIAALEPVTVQAVWCAECQRKEELILKLQRGMARREDMAQQIRDLIADRDHWRGMAQNGSRSQARKLNEYRERAIFAEEALERARALAERGE